MGSLINCFKAEPKKEDKRNNNMDKLDDVEKTILNSKLARDKVKAYIKRMESAKEKQKELAKECLKNNNREKAKIHLTRSKAYESQIESGQGQLNLLEEQIMMIDQTKIQSNAMKALQTGNELLKKLQEETSIEKWEKISDDMNEARENHKELQEYFQKQGISEEDYEAEIDKELEKLMNLKSNNIEEYPELNKNQDLKNKDEIKDNESKNELVA